MNVLNPLTLTLQGRQIIEASAGTGKTWTLAALYVRLVLGHGRPTPLLPPQILVMTFTEAATAELRDRIRQRLHQAARFFDLSAQQRDIPDALAIDDFLQQLRDNMEVASWRRCALQLHQAAEWMDDAAIYTIHAWSKRMLSQHALQSHTLFEQTRLEQADQLKLQLVQDYWRQWFYPLSADHLQALTPLIGKEPAFFFKQLAALWREQERTPQTPAVPEADPHQAIAQLALWQAHVRDTAQAAREAWSSEVLQALRKAREEKLISGTGITSKNFESWLSELQAWAEQGREVAIGVLARFGTQALQDKKWQGAADFAFFDRLQTHVQACQSPNHSLELVAKHAAYTVAQSYQQAKQQRAAFDFSDLLQQLHRAVTTADTSLARAIQAQYPVALVDEFQDTDPWQYDTLDRIYDHAHCDSRHALIMIGDPKQAIYSFRGADLATYLRARANALAHNPQACHTLTGNHRSQAALVNAINHVFMQCPNPFACNQGEMAFTPVQAQSKSPALTLDAQPLAALHVWYLPPEPEQEVVTVNHYLRQAAAVFADHMAGLLNHPSGQLHPGQMAVLVRHQHQAHAMRQALRERQIPSVYLSDQTSVYSTPEALDLWRLLRAVASPRHTGWVRAAVGSRLWGLDLREVHALTRDETAWEALLDQFHHWHHVWQRQGVLPMLHVCLHSQKLAQRVLNSTDGERRMSNLLHLGELLQHASQHLQGELALVRFLGEQIQQPPRDSDAQQARLETDARCVKVITYHKSKGLQYPLVFVPFAGAFAVEKKAKAGFGQDDDDDVDPDTSLSAEEDMRLLYVALTRAQQAVWLGLAETRNDITGDQAKGNLKRSAVSQLLMRQKRGDLLSQLQTLWAPCPDIAIRPMPAVAHIVYAPPAPAAATQNARTPVRHHVSDWWTASFSALTRSLSPDSLQEEAFADALHDAHPHASEAAQISVAPPAVDGGDDNPWQNFPAGARYGTLLHDLLEWQAQHLWPAAQRAQGFLQQPWQDLLARKARWLQLTHAQQLQLDQWVTRIVHAPLPLQGLGPDLVLHSLSSEQLWAEMEFSFEAHRVSSAVLDRLIQTHVLPGQTRPALQTRTLHGMLTGFIDVVLQHDSKYWVLDYKSNRLPQYDPASLDAAILDKRYEVQYVLYTLALHRLLKARLADYDYDRHVGGCIYVFLRGIDSPGAGVHAWRPARALIEALDQAFASSELA